MTAYVIVFWFRWFETVHITSYLRKSKLLFHSGKPILESKYVPLQTLFSQNNFTCALLQCYNTLANGEAGMRKVLLLKIKNKAKPGPDVDVKCASKLYQEPGRPIYHLTQPRRLFVLNLERWRIDKIDQIWSGFLSLVTPAWNFSRTAQDETDRKPPYPCYENDEDQKTFANYFSRKTYTENQKTRNKFNLLGLARTESSLKRRQ